jgi:hypothetical protein
MTKKIDVIYFDMDGVLVDFFGYIRQFIPSIIDGENYQPGISEFMDATVERFSLFEILPPKKDFDIGIQLIASLFHLRNIRTEILSSSSLRLYSKIIEQQKSAWLNANKLGHLKTNFVRGSEAKAIYGAPRNILVDDDATSGHAFEKKGGKWIHHINFLDTAKQLDDYINEKPLPAEHHFYGSSIMGVP